MRFSTISPSETFSLMVRKIEHLEIQAWMAERYPNVMTERLNKIFRSSKDIVLSERRIKVQNPNREGYALPAPEREELLQLIVRRVDGRVPLVVSTGRKVMCGANPPR